MDPRIKEILKKEEERQQNNIELIASENYTSKAVRELAGSIFTTTTKRCFLKLNSAPSAI